MNNNKSVEYIVKEVLTQYVGSQINLDSEAARDLISKHIASTLEMEARYTDGMDGHDLDTSKYTDDWSADHVSDDFTL